MATISEEQAVKEVDSWLDFRKVSDSKRVINRNSIYHLVMGIMEGNLILTEEFNFEQTLKFPIGDVKKLVYKPRLEMGSVAETLKGVLATDSIGNTLAYGAALTGTAMSIMKKLNSEDYPLVDHISFFFMA